jgi:hypothetical protein
MGVDRLMWLRTLNDCKAVMSTVMYLTSVMNLDIFELVA